MRSLWVLQVGPAALRHSPVGRVQARI